MHGRRREFHILKKMFFTILKLRCNLKQHHLQMILSGFLTNKDMLLHNHNITSKIRKFKSCTETSVPAAFTSRPNKLLPGTGPAQDPASRPVCPVLAFDSPPSVGSTQMLTSMLGSPHQSWVMTPHRPPSPRGLQLPGAAAQPLTLWGSPARPG